MKTKKLTKFRPIILSRHPSHTILRAQNKSLPLNPFRSIIRFGSTTPTSKYETKGKQKILVEINTPEAVKNSSSKLLMKQCFDKAKVKTCKWWKAEDFKNKEEVSYPIIVKKINGSRGKGMQKFNTYSEFEEFFNNDKKERYIVEEYFTGVREYRLHVTEDGCFYTCRKVLKSNTPDDVRWKRNDETCAWLLETNEKFDKPVNWKEIEKDCVNALKAVGLDIGAIDLRIQSSTNKEGKKRKNPEWRIIEINSAPSFGNLTSEKYKEIIPNLLRTKYEQTKNA